MNHFLQRQLLRRVILSTLFVAVLAGSVSLFYQIQRLEEHVKSIATETGNNQVKSFLQQYREACEQQHTLQPSIDISNTGFVLVTILDSNKKILFSETTENYPLIRSQIKAIDHHFSYGDDHRQVKIIHNHIENRFYIRILSPALLPENRNGYIRVLYRVSDAELKKVYTEILLNVLLTIFAIVVLFAMLYPVILFLNRKLIKRTEALSNANLQIMDVLGAAIAKRDNETNSHNYRVTLYALALGEALELDEQQMQALLKGAFLHDVGKIGITDAILLKPGKLDQEEYHEMKKHVLYGQEIIAHSSWLDDARDVIVFHHEKYDGSGYMEGLTGNDIPLNARIFAIVDVFDALTSVRPYKEAYSYEKSITMLKEASGTHFDPQLLERFIAIIRPIYVHIAGKEDETWLQKELLPYTEQYL